jgi:hypothetical protein
LLRSTSGREVVTEVDFKTINQAYNSRGYFFTFEIPVKQAINRILLNFNERNYDWLIRLEGSQDQQEWFTILDKFRILSIKNEYTDYSFSKLDFPKSNYKFYRVLIGCKGEPELESAKIEYNAIEDGQFRTYKQVATRIVQDKEIRETKVDVELKLPVPVCELTVFVNSVKDFYRPVYISYLVDSTKTTKGWKQNFYSIASGTLTSMEKNKFSFTSTVIQKIRIQISNYDDQPLTIDSVCVKGNLYELAARFPDSASFFLAYGNPTALKPNYDINKFYDKIPANLVPLQPGKEVVSASDLFSKQEPLFIKKYWLWLVMIAIILLLGWFSISMIRKH